MTDAGSLLRADSLKAPGLRIDVGPDSLGELGPTSFLAITPSTPPHSKGSTEEDLMAFASSPSDSKPEHMSTIERQRELLRYIHSAVPSPCGAQPVCHEEKLIARSADPPGLGFRTQSRDFFDFSVLDSPHGEMLMQELEASSPFDGPAMELPTGEGEDAGDVWGMGVKICPPVADALALEAGLALGEGISRAVSCSDLGGGMRCGGGGPAPRGLKRTRGARSAPSSPVRGGLPSPAAAGPDTPEPSCEAGGIMAGGGGAPAVASRPLMATLAGQAPPGGLPGAALKGVEKPKGGNGKQRKKRRSSTRCLNCGAHSTPQWRAGPQGPKTLCNACGVRHKKGLELTPTKGGEDALAQWEQNRLEREAALLMPR